MKLLKTMSLIVGATLLLNVPSAIACFALPRKLARPHAEVVSEAKMIFWAEVLTSEPSKHADVARKPVRYKLKVLRVIKGDVGASVEIKGDGDLSGIWDTTFSNHVDAEFWKEASGRMGIHGDCSMAPPHFIVGKRYLVLLSPNEDTKQFERVDNESDRWLQYVADKVKATAGGGAAQQGIAPLVGSSSKKNGD